MAVNAFPPSPMPAAPTPLRSYTNRMLTAVSANDADLSKCF